MVDVYSLSEFSKEDFQSIPFLSFVKSFNMFLDFDLCCRSPDVLSVLFTSLRGHLVCNLCMPSFNAVPREYLRREH